MSRRPGRSDSILQIEALRERRPGELSYEGRRLLFLGAAAIFAAVLIVALTGLPDFSDATPLYGQLINEVAVEERATTAIVTAVNFDYRAFDTLGEEFILFAAVLGLALLLRKQEDETRHMSGIVEFPDRGHLPTSSAVRLVTLLLVGPTMLLAFYVIGHGHLTPGGGFQGGVIAATALLLVFLGVEYREMRRLRPIGVIEVAKSAGAAAFILIGVGGLIAGAAFLENFLPAGTAGDLIAAGTIPALSFAVGIEVAGGFVLLLSSFLDQLLMIWNSDEAER